MSTHQKPTAARSWEDWPKVRTCWWPCRNCAREHGITLGEVQAIGAVSQARVGFYHQAERKYYFLELPRPLEIASLMGNISLKDGEPIVHAHVTLTDREPGGLLAVIWPKAPWSLPANSPSRNTGPPRRWWADG